MYNPEGSDTGKEWIEIYNNGDEQIDLTGWKLFENNTNHKINPGEDGEGLNLPPNTFGIIVDNVAKFKENYGSFDGLIFDSVFSLSNTGEVLIIRDSDLNDIDSVDYISDWGANGDGQTLQIIDGNWVVGGSTMGGENSLSLNSSGDVGSGDGGSSNSPSSGKNSITKFMIYADAGVDRKVIVGADTMFEAKAFGLDDKPLENARYVWSFGEGTRSEGKNILHTYNYPGEYVVILNVSSGEYSASDRVVVKAVPAEIVISSVDIINNFIEIYNKSSYEINLSWWRIKSGKDYFTLPKDTVILPNNKIKFSPQTIGLNIGNINQIYLLYPNGLVADYYDPYLLEEVGSKNIEKHKQSVKQIPKPNLIFDNDVQNDLIKDNQNETKESQLSLVSASVDDSLQEKNLFNKWTLSLGSLILVSMAGILFVKDSELNLKGEDDRLNPDKFDIID